MGRLIYNLFLPLGFLFFLPELILKYRSRGGWKSTFGERFGRYGNREKELQKQRGAIWIHAVSVGETIVALSMIRKYLRRYPDRKFIISTTTTTGQDVARSNCPANTSVIFCPLDFPCMVRRALNLMQPAALVIFETEIWPNLISIAARKKIPVLLVNARMSDHSARGYRKLSKVFFDSLLRKFNLIMTQSDADAERFLAVSPRARVKVVGNMKFDQVLPELPLNNVLHRYFGDDPENLILLAGSTHPGEEALMADCYAALKKEFPKLKFVIVPRHAERGGDIAEMLQTKGLSYARRSCDSDFSGECDVLLADTTGEMLLLMNGADIIIMGKSFAGHDEGHNLIEPALLGKPIVTGLNLRNFRYIFASLESQGALLASNDEDLPANLHKLISSEKLRKELGERACQIISANRGATDRTIDALEEIITPWSKPCGLD